MAIDIKRWEEIGNDLGEVTDVKISVDNDILRVDYKSSGTPKYILYTDSTGKALIQSLLFIKGECTI